MPMAQGVPSYILRSNRIDQCAERVEAIAHDGRVLSGYKANSEKRSYSVMEVAEILGVSKKSVYNMCANGTFKCVRIGTRLRISKKAFDDWLDGRDNT